MALAGGCEFLTASYFPSYLSSAVASRDMSDLVGDSDDINFYLELVPGLGGELLFLGIQKPGMPSEIAILDESLDLRKHFTEPALAASLGAAYAGGRLGNMTTVDISGQYVVGNFVFDPTTLLPILDLQQAGGGIAADGAGFADPISIWHYVISTNGSDLEIWERDNFWNDTPLADPYLIPLAPPGSDYYEALLAYPITDDPLFSTLLVFLSGGDLIVGAALAGAWPTFPGLAGSLLEDPASFVYQRIPNVRDDQVWLTADGLVIGTNDNEYELRDIENLPKVKASQRFDDTYRQTVTYSLDGEFYYLLDHVTKRLYKLATWW
jgi:hypothetical protein